MKCCLLLLFLVHAVQCYNVLFMLPMGSKSHKNVFDPVAEELAKRGHKVVMFSSIEVTNDPPGVKNIMPKAFKAKMDSMNFNFFNGSMASFSVLTNVFKLMYELTELLFEDQFIVDLVKEPLDPLTNKPKYDVVIIDGVFQDFTLAFGYHMGVPNVYFSSSGFFYHQLWNLDVPHPLSYIPATTSDFPEPMTFFNRALNTFSNILFLILMNHICLPNQDVIVKRFLPNTPPLVELSKNVSFMLSHSHPAINVRQPSMPYMAEVGGLNCMPAKPLPKELEDFMQEAGKDGVIYFSLGTVTKGEMMPLEMRDKIIKVFSQLPQKIIWKYETEIPSLPKNVKLVKWAPQNDLLGHPQLRLFITHGGLLSINEAAYNGCPILGFPLSADQLGNMAQAKLRGVGEYLEWRTFTSQQFLDTINRILNDQSYKEKSLLSSVRLKDRLQDPAEKAAYWIEYVVRHNGAHFLKSSASHLNFFQYFLLDVLAALLAVLIVAGIVLFYIIKFSFRLVPYLCHSFGFFKGTHSKKTQKKKKN